MQLGFECCSWPIFWISGHCDQIGIVKFWSELSLNPYLFRIVWILKGMMTYTSLNWFVECLFRFAILHRYPSVWQCWPFLLQRWPFNLYLNLFYFILLFIVHFAQTFYFTHFDTHKTEAVYFIATTLAWLKRLRTTQMLRLDMIFRRWTWNFLSKIELRVIISCNEINYPGWCI